MYKKYVNSKIKNMSETTLYETQPQIADQANSPLQDNAEQLAQNQFAIAELEQAAQEGIDTKKKKRHLVVVFQKMNENIC